MITGKNESKEKYLELANKGCAEACFLLGYKFSGGYEYYIKDAELGSVKGMKYALSYWEESYLDAQGKSNHAKVLDFYNRTQNINFSNIEDQK